MLFLKTDADLSTDAIDMIRNQIKERTGEDCVILPWGLSVERIPVAKDKAAPGQEAAQSD